MRSLRIFRELANATAFEFFRFPPFAEADTFKDRTLNEEDVPKVVCEILEVQTKSKTFGRVLGLPKVTVDSIHKQNSDPQECLIGVLDELVKQVEPPPTWRVIVEALRNPLIGHSRLAQQIESKYCPLPPTDDGSYTYSVSQSVHELFVVYLISRATSCAEVRARCCYHSSSICGVLQYKPTRYYLLITNETGGQIEKYFTEWKF